ncbi:MAG TPA: hypothetical protein ENN45_03150 [Bacteroidetes bacterium]|nr:hypothetical protein [Bacteroidota bacterium]
MKKPWIIWLLAVLITLTAVYYQRKTGPTHPKFEKIVLNGKEYKLKFLRSYGEEKDCKINFSIPDKLVEATIYYKRYPTPDSFIAMPMKRQGDELVAYLPQQPPAGKIAYYIELQEGNNYHYLLKEEPVIIRFKGKVPNGIIISHVLLIFLAMFFSNLAGLFAVAKKDQFRKWAYVAFSLLLVGGMIFGPIMQKYAFGAFWTGFPNGMDLTDNKTLIAFLFWAIAIIMNIRKKRAGWVVAAAIIMLLINSIPHSFMGSELDYKSNEVITASLGEIGVYLL